MRIETKQNLLAILLIVIGMVCAAALDAPCHGQCSSWMCNSDADCGSTCRCWFGRQGVGRCG